MPTNETKGSRCVFCGHVVSVGKSRMGGFPVFFAQCPMCLARGPVQNKAHYSEEFAKELAIRKYKERVKDAD